MEKIRIAVVGLGPAGLTSLKALREEGFHVDAFERRGRVGGVWAYTDCLHHTSVIPETVSNVNKFLSGFSDFPVPEDWPVYMTGRQLAEYFQSYARHFQLEPHIRFSTTVTKVIRDEQDRGWNVYIKGLNGDEILYYDKVVFGNGSDTLPKWPPLPGKERFNGAVIHGQQFRNPEQYKGKKVVVVGIGNTACEIALSLAQQAHVYQSYRHGRIILSRFYENGIPSDMAGSWPSLRFQDLLRHYCPSLSRRLADRQNQRQMVSDAIRLDPLLNRPGLSQRQRRKLAEDRIRREWHLLPCASVTHVHPVVQEHWIPALSQQKITPARGFKQFGDGKQVLFDDGSTIDDVDVVIFCTGYELDFSVFPALQMDDACGIPLSTVGETRSNHTEPSLPRLFQMMFPPKWASSIAFLSWTSVLDTAWCFYELSSMAVAQAWAADTAEKLGATAKSPSIYRPPAQLPSEEHMNASVDAYHDWWRKQWRKERSFHPGYPQSYKFVRFLHDTAGTGMFEHMNHIGTLGRWRLWYEDRELYTWLTKGPANNHALRLFDTNPEGVPGCGRRTWEGAREAMKNEYNRFKEYKTHMENQELRQQVLNSVPKGR